MNVYYFHAESGFIFFLQNTADPDQPKAHGRAYSIPVTPASVRRPSVNVATNA